MKASELVEKLNALIAENGDQIVELQVTYYGWSYYSEAVKVEYSGDSFRLSV